jgi:hypothetical protein
MSQPYNNAAYDQLGWFGAVFQIRYVLSGLPSQDTHYWASRLPLVARGGMRNKSPARAARGDFCAGEQHCCEFL